MAATAFAVAGGLAGAVPGAAAPSDPGAPQGLDTFVATPGVPAGSLQPDPEVQERESLRLDSSRTSLLAPDGSLAPRQPRLVRRDASIWMSSVNGGPPSDAQEIRSLDVVQDVSGKKVTVTARYDGSPSASANSALFVWFGSWNSAEDTCTAKVQLAGVAATSSSSDADAVHTDNTSAGTASRSLSGDTLRVTWTGGSAGATGYTCVYARSFVVTGNTIGTQVEGGGADDFDATYEKAPQFDFYSSSLNAAYPGKWNKVYVSIRNEGDAPASNVTLTGKGAKLKFRKKTVSLGTIAPGKSKSVNLQVKLTGKKIRTLNLTAKAKGNWSATSRTKVGFRPKPKKLKKLAGRSFWASPMKQYTGWNVQQLTFVNKKWVFEGVPKAGWPKKCSKKTKGCKRYTYKPGKKLLKIGKVRAKVNSEGIRTKGKNKVFYTPLTKPKANLRPAVKLSYYDYNGCEASFSCSSWWRHLTLKKDGTFTWTYEAIHSSGIPPNQVFVAVSGPDKKGRYQFLSGGRLRINFVDEETGKATTETHTVGVDQDVLGRHGPDKGLLLGSMPHTP